MVTTRSSTGKLPAARPADPLLTVLDDVNDARRSRQTRVNVKRAVVGGDDRLSRLPWEVLRSILCGCHPWSLIQLSRTSHTFRNYLTSRQSIAVWKAARTSLEVWRRTKKIDTWGHPAYAYSTNKPIKGGSPVLLSCPGPPNGISEMQYALAYIPSGETSPYCCSFCGVAGRIERYETIGIGACDDCETEHLVQQRALRAAWANEAAILDERIWKHLPFTSVYGMAVRRLCEQTKVSQYRYEVECGFNATKLKEWHSQRTQQRQLEVQQSKSYKAWVSAHMHMVRFTARNVQLQRRQTLADMLGVLCTEYGYVIQDVDELVSFLEEIPQDHLDNPRACIHDHTNILQAIVSTRLYQEDYINSTTKRTTVKSCLHASLTQLRMHLNTTPLSDLMGSTIDISHSGFDEALLSDISSAELADFVLESCIMNVMRLPAVAGLPDISANQTAQQLSNAWNTAWQRILFELVASIYCWRATLAGKIAASSTDAAASHLCAISEIDTRFKCNLCYQGNLLYPELLMHSCVSTTKSTSRYSELSLWRSPPLPMRASTIDLSKLQYDRESSLKYIRMCQAMEKAGRIKPSRVESASPGLLNGHFTCNKCSTAATFDWNQIHEHIGTVAINQRNLPEGNGKRVQHKVIAFVPNTIATAGPTA